MQQVHVPPSMAGHGSYIFSNGFRLVIPHLDMLSTRVKGAWVGKEAKQVMVDYLPFIPEADLTQAFASGRVLVDNRAIGPNHSMALNQTLQMVFHRHEPAVLNEPVQILHMNEDMVVVSKPGSIPVHPIGRFKKNSILSILHNEHPELLEGGKELKLVHRLDRLVSGVLILARSRSAVAQLQKHMFEDFLEKEYVARVKGTFPEGRLEVCQPVAMLHSDPPLYGVPSSSMLNDAKASHTVFERLKVAPNGSESLVCCRPITGRSHQIRVHLQWLGHPITNDFKYGGKTMRLHPPPPEPPVESYAPMEWCSECRAGRRDVSRVTAEDLNAFSIWLHSRSYTSTHPCFPWRFESPLPHWADL